MKFPEGNRIKKAEHPLNSNEGDPYGAFYLDRRGNRPLFVIANCAVPTAPGGVGWDHVSVTLARPKHRDETPTWEDMCLVKSLFWSDDEEVFQFHPAKSEYVNNHPGCLHLWRPVGIAIPTPPKEFV